MNWKPQQQTLAVSATAAILMALSGAANASGFRVPEVSIAGLGTANALVANHKETGALPYNPAAMAFHDGSNFVPGLLIVEPSTEVKTASGSHDSDPDSPFFIPNLYLMAHLGSDWTYGLSINSPFGLQTKWKLGTFPNFGPLAALFEPKTSTLKMVNVNSNFGYKIGSGTGVAFGIDHYQVKKTQLDTQTININGTGADWGWNVAVLHASDPWSFGLSYRSSVKVTIDGIFDAQNAPGFGAAASAETEIEFPDLLQAGVRYQATSHLGIEFDVEHTKWSTFDKLVVTNTTAGSPLPGTLASNTNEWNDVNAYRLGVTYQINPRTQLRLGYAQDKTPQDAEHFTARIPDADRQLFSFGVKHAVSGWDFEGGIMYVMWDDRTIDSTTSFNPAAPDPNGTAAYNGKYQSNAILVGLGASTKF